MYVAFVSIVLFSARQSFSLCHSSPANKVQPNFPITGQDSQNKKSFLFLKSLIVYYDKVLIYIKLISKYIWIVSVKCAIFVSAKELKSDHLLQTISFVSSLVSIVNNIILRKKIWFIIVDCLP